MSLKKLKLKWVIGYYLYEIMGLTCERLTIRCSRTRGLGHLQLMVLGGASWKGRDGTSGAAELKAVMWFMCDAILKMQRSPGDEQVLPQQMLFPGVLNYD